jgi:hypothetical protein
VESRAELQGWLDAPVPSASRGNPGARGAGVECTESGGGPDRTGSPGEPHAHGVAGLAGSFGSAAGRRRWGAVEDQATKGDGWMPWGQEPKKGAAHSEMPRGAASMR